MCAEVARSIGRKDVVTFDMGGTTAKLGAIDNGTPAIMPTFEVDLVRSRRGSGLPLNVPAVEMQEIGAGGGSIARVEKGMITVGPDSAGADSWADLLQQGRDASDDHRCQRGARLHLAGPLQCGHDDARRGGRDSEGFEVHVARPLGISAQEAAWGVHMIATTNMENALRLVSVERGRDPRNYAMVAFGGAGPLHAARLARRAGVPQVVVPNGAGVGSAIGLLQATPRIDVSTTRVLRLDGDGRAGAIEQLYRKLEVQARARDRAASAKAASRGGHAMRKCATSARVSRSMSSFRAMPDRCRPIRQGHRSVPRGLSPEEQVRRRAGNC